MVLRILLNVSLLWFCHIVFLALHGCGGCGEWILTGDCSIDQQVETMDISEVLESEGEEPAAELPLTWAKSYGDQRIESVVSAALSSDAGYVFMGISLADWSLITWMIKIDSYGDIIWENEIDIEYRTHTPTGMTLISIGDGEYAATGGNFILRVWTMAEDGSIRWMKRYQSPGDFYGSCSIQQTLEGEYVIAGWRKEDSDSVDPDLFLLKIERNGEIEWQRSYGGPDEDWAYWIDQTHEGGYIVGGYTKSFGSGDEDAWILRLGNTGEIIWQKRIGGSGDDEILAIVETHGGDFLAAGWTNSFEWPDYDSWIIKLNQDGEILWQKRYGGPDWDLTNSIIRTESGHFVAAGQTSWNTWVFKIDENGTVLWERTFGAELDDISNDIKETREGGFILAGDVFIDSTHNYDYYVLKLDQEGNMNAPCSFIVPEEPSSHVIETDAVPMDTTAVPVEADAEASDETFTVTATQAEVRTYCGD